MLDFGRRVINTAYTVFSVEINRSALAMEDATEQSFNLTYILFLECTKILHYCLSAIIGGSSGAL